MITKEQFLEYERVRVSGVTNMFDVSTVGALTGLTRSELIEIMQNYLSLREKYLVSCVQKIESDKDVKA